MTSRNLGICLWIVSLLIITGSAVLIAVGDGEGAGALISLGVVFFWSPALVMKASMIRVRILAQLWGREVTRTDIAIVSIGSCIVGPIFGFLLLAVLFLLLAVLGELLAVLGEILGSY